MLFIIWRSNHKCGGFLPHHPKFSALPPPSHDSKGLNRLYVCVCVYNINRKKGGHYTPGLLFYTHTHTIKYYDIIFMSHHFEPFL